MSRPSGRASVLDGILFRARQRVAEEAVRRPLAEVRAAAAAAPPRRPFAATLTRAGRANVIAEHKRRSPSRGPIREDLAPGDVARAYAAAGAVALSVLTEPESFGGRLEHLVEARSAVTLPVLRKDFVVDAWQLWEARAAGADAALLIVAALDDAALEGLLAVAREAELEALVEVHDRAELERALAAGATIVGVNNRDLRTLEVRIETSLDLAPAIPADVVAVAESGLRRGADLRRLREAGFDAFLVGESLMSSADPGAALRALVEEAEVVA
jgi:indole-3-glycerol phosphate synthase